MEDSAFSPPANLPPRPSAGPPLLLVPASIGPRLCPPARSPPLPPVMYLDRSGRSPRVPPALYPAWSPAQEINKRRHPCLRAPFAVDRCSVPAVEEDNNDEEEGG